MLRHQAGAPAQDPPGQQRADEGVAETDPGGGQTILPAELAGVSDEDDRRKLRGAECESREPGTDIAASQDETLYVRSGPAAIDADTDHHGKEQDQENTLN